MPKCVLLGIVLASAVSAFAVTCGACEYWLACSSTTLADGAERELTPRERVARFAGATVAATPVGLKAVGLLVVPLAGVARALRSAPGAAGFAVGSGCGCAGGAALSVAVYALVGGWGPPAFYPAVAAGLVLAAGLVAVQRTKSPAEPGAAPDPAI